MKLGNFTLVLSGRNDWVETTQAARDTGATLASRDDSRFSGRAGLIYNFDNGIAPYVVLRHELQPDHRPSTRKTSCSCRRPASRRKSA